MNDAPMKQAPSLNGWIIAAGAGLTALGVAKMALGVSTWGSVFGGLVVFGVVGVILGLPGRAGTPMMPADAQPRSLAATMPTSDTFAAPEAFTAIDPMVAAFPVPEVPVVAARPMAMDGPRDGRSDDLKIIVGIGPKLEALCNRLGFWHFDQIAGWTASEMAWVDDNLEGFRGRVTRDRWVAQARTIVDLGAPEFLRRLDAGEAV